MAKTPAPRKKPAYGETTDPGDVTKPVMALVHKNLKKAWRVDQKNQMCWIFDSVSPARQWKRGCLKTAEEEFVEYGPSPWPELTETDDDNILQAYFPREVM